MTEADKAENSAPYSLMKDVDHVASRVAVAAALGGISGATLGIYRGHNVPKIAQTMGLNFAMTATACIGSQQLALAAGRTLLKPKGDGTPSSSMILASHGIGGAVGGGLLGGLYIGKPIRGMVFLVPVMLVIGMFELRFDETRRIDPAEWKKNELQLTRNLDGSLRRPRPQD